MKKITLVLVCLIYISINKSYASNDSLVTHNDTLKEIISIIEEEETLVKKDKKIVEQSHLIVGCKVNKPESVKLLKKPQGFGDFIGGLMDLVSQLWKPVWGYYEEDNMRKEGPYFLFMNNYNKLNL
jgi:hypothetical protein